LETTTGSLNGDGGLMATTDVLTKGSHGGVAQFFVSDLFGGVVV
jgi:hypothetical protein